MVYIDSRIIPVSMSVRSRTDIIKAFTYFSPASVAVIARIEHMEQVPDMNLQCLQLLEDGLLETVPSPSGIVEYQLTATGREIINSATVLHVPSTKYIIYNQLRIKEKDHAILTHLTLHTILDNKTFLCILELRHFLPTTITIPQLSSVLYGLLNSGKICLCGPLFGVVREPT